MSKKSKSTPRVIVKKAGPVRRFFSITGAVLSTAAVAAGVTFAVPQSREYVSDWLAAHFSPQYKELETQKDTLTESNTMYAEQVTTLNGRITTLNANIETANTEKTQLQTQLTAADRKSVV